MREKAIAEVGDFVVLNSGGPLMYVDEIESYLDHGEAHQKVRCSWNSTDGEKQDEHFPIECVTVHIFGKEA